MSPVASASDDLSFVTTRPVELKLRSASVELGGRTRMVNLVLCFVVFQSDTVSQLPVHIKKSSTTLFKMFE